MSLSLIAFITLGAWIYLLFFRGGFWRADQRLSDVPAPLRWPAVVAVIPARDEADSIGAVVSAHLASDYPGTFSVVVADDHSTDATKERALQAGEKSVAPDRRLEIVDTPPLPEGWSGKLWAVHNGLQRAREIAPEAAYVLLTDADIVLGRDALRRLVAKAGHQRLAIASLMARLDARMQWAALLIPAFVFFFQKLYPFPRANDPTDNLAAAAGGCMLARADALEAIGGVASIRGDLIDDCALARRIKDISPSTAIWLGLADEDEAKSLRDNRSLASVWNMVARTAYAQLNRSPLLLAGTLLGMALLYLAPPLIALSFAVHGSVAAMFFALCAWGFMAYAYWPTLKLYDREPWEAALLPIAGALYAAMTFSSAWRHWRGRGGQWKGRSY